MPASHAAEEVERLVTTSVEMNGVPHMIVMRSISLYGLSDVILTFEDSTSDYFALRLFLSAWHRPRCDGVTLRHRSIIQSQCLDTAAT